MTQDIYVYDRRSRKSLFMSYREWRECKEKVKDFIDKGYGLQILPPIDNAESANVDYLIQSIINLAEEMIHRGHEIVFLKREGNRSEIDRILNELYEKGLDIDVRSC